jgi:hypothetical protein
MNTMQHAVKKALGWTPRAEPRRKANRRRFVVVDRQAYFVYQRAGYFHAVMNQMMGWASVMSDTYEGLTQCIRLARADRQ